MSTLWLTIGVIAIVFGGFHAVMNWGGAIVSMRSGRNVSMVPFVGGILLGTGIYLVVGSIWWALLAACLDLGFLPMLAALPHLFGEMWSTSRFARVHRFVHRDDKRTITLDLFRRGRALFRLEIDRGNIVEVREPVLAGMGLHASWQVAGDGYEIFDYVDGRRLKLNLAADAYAGVETGGPDDESAFPRLDGMRFVAVSDR